MQLFHWYFRNIFSDKKCEWETDNSEWQYLVATSKSCLCVRAVTEVSISKYCNLQRALDSPHGK